MDADKHYLNLSCEKTNIQLGKNTCKQDSSANTQLRKYSILLNSQIASKTQYFMRNKSIPSWEIKKNTQLNKIKSFREREGERYLSKWQVCWLEVRGRRRSGQWSRKRCCGIGCKALGWRSDLGEESESFMAKRGK